MRNTAAGCFTVGNHHRFLRISAFASAMPVPGENDTTLSAGVGALSGAGSDSLNADQTAGSKR